MFYKKYSKKGFTPLEIWNKFLMRDNFLKSENHSRARVRNRKPLTGFTLIELLVVVAVIGILASIILVSVKDLQARGRDDRRFSDMKAISNALGMHQVQNSTYPIQEAAAPITGSDAISLALIGDKALVAAPVDTVNTGSYIYTYQSLNSGASYVLTFCLETDAIKGYTAGCGKTILL